MAAGASGTLANFWVELGSKGLEQVNKEIRGIGVGLAQDEAANKSLAQAFAQTLPTAGGQAVAAAASVGKIGSAMASVGHAAGTMASGVASSFNAMSRTAGAAIGSLTGMVQGLVRAGLAGTVEGERLNWAWTQLSREVAAIFLPVIRAVTETLQSVVSWFRNLSREQQGAVLAIGGTIIALGLLFKALTVLSLHPIVGVFVLLAAAIALVGEKMLEAQGRAAKLRESMLAVAQGKATKDDLAKAYEKAGIKEGDTPEEKAKKARATMNDPEHRKELEQAHKDLGHGKTWNFLHQTTVGNAQKTVNEHNALSNIETAGKKGKNVETVGGKKDHDALTLAPGGFEQITNSYKRIQEASGKQGLAATTKERDEKREKEETKKRTDDLLKLGERFLQKLGFIVPNNSQGQG